MSRPSKAVSFSSERDEQVKALAIYIATLEKEGVRYEVEELIGGWRVKTTGGF